MTERDPIVAVALAQRPVPDHAPGFWHELEARLAATPTGTEPDEDTEATVIPLADAPSRRRRWLVLAAGVVSAAAVATVAIALVSDDEDGRDVVTTDPTTVTTAPAPPTSITPTPTPAPTLPLSTVPALDTFPGVWPFTSYAEVAVYLASGSAEYADPRLVVERFATDIIGVVDPVVTLATSTEDGLDVVVEVRTRTEAGEVNNNLPPTIVTTRRVGDDTPSDPAGPWVVTGATSEAVTIESPAAGAAVVSPLSVTGQGRGYEGTVSVSLYSRSTMIADPAAAIAGNPELGPYSVRLSFATPSAGQHLMLVARTDSGADFVGVPAFAVTRLVAGSTGSSADPAQVVGAFLAAAGAGDIDTAWDLVDPAAQTAGGGRTAFDAFASDYRQDLTALAGVPLAAYATRRWSPTSENEPDVTVVTVAGDLNADAPTALAFAVAAGKIVSTFPVEDDPAVDAVGWVGNTLPAGQPLEILVPTSAAAPNISIDGDGTPIEPSSVQPFAGEPQSNATFPMPNTQGLHVLTLAFLRPDGLVHAEAQLMTFTAPGPAATTPEESVRQFLEAASRGDAAAAWTLLDPAAQAENGDGIAFELSLQADDYGWAAFAALPDDAYSSRAWATGTPETQPETAVVTVAGDVMRDGATEFDVVAFPVMRSADGYRLVWTPAPRLQSLPARGAWPSGAIGGAPNGGLYFGPVTLPDGTSAPAISEPGGEPSGSNDVSGGFTYFEVPAEPSGRRIITLSYLDTTGLVHAEVEVYNV